MPPRRDDSAAPAFLRKAIENVGDAEVALAAGRLNACANRSYYAAFQAAVAALWAAGVRPPRDVEGTLSHKMVQAEWSGRLIYRRKLYPPELRDTLLELMRLRLIADYRAEGITMRQARRALAACTELVRHVEVRLGPAAPKEESNGVTA